jgi:hypothetical protein
MMMINRAILFSFGIFFLCQGSKAQRREHLGPLHGNPVLIQHDKKQN